MIRAAIFIDGQPYRGEDLDARYPATPGATPGARNYLSDDQPHKLLIGGGEPRVIEGHRNLASHVQTIMRRIQEGHVAASSIHITLAGGESEK